MVRPWDGYHKLPIYPSDRYKTAFSCCYGISVLNFMTFVFCNAPSTFQQIMNKVFIEILYNEVVIY